MGRLQSLLRLPIGVYVGWALVVLTWLSAIFLGVVAWKDAFDGEVWPLEDLLHSLKQHWFVLLLILVATFLTLLHPGTRILRVSKSTDSQIYKSTNLVAGMHRLRKSVTCSTKKPSGLVPAYEHFLRAAENDLEYHLGLVEDVIKVSLMLIETEKDLRVVARSKAGSPIDKLYSLESRSVSKASIEENRTVIRTVKKGEGRRSYSYCCVSATPMTMNRKAYGVITVDSTSKRALWGKDELVGRVLRPYCAAILLTLSKDAPCIETVDSYER